MTDATPNVEGNPIIPIVPAPIPVPVAIEIGPKRFFNFKMDMGQLMVLMGIVGSVLGGYYSFDYRIHYLEKAFEQQLDHQSTIIESSIRHDEQFKYIAEQVGDIKMQLRAASTPFNKR